MTSSIARRELAAWMRERGLNFNSLHLEMVLVLKRQTVTPRTLQRFLAAEQEKPHAGTVADIADYLKAAKRKAA